MDFKEAARQRLLEIRRDIRNKEKQQLELQKPKKMPKEKPAPGKPGRPRGKARKICGIYKITCLVNNKVYIGASKDIKARWSQHFTRLKHQSKYAVRKMQDDFNEYGKENFELEILMECEPEELLRNEMFFTKKYQSHKTGYNNKLGTLYL